MEKQYLLIAEQISFRNNKLSAINVWDQFNALHLPAKFNFDLAFICGPNWREGEYELKFKVKAQSGQEAELGTIEFKMGSQKSVFNAIASNLNFGIEKNSGNITFIVEKNGEEIFTREYPVNYLLEVKEGEAELATA